MKLFRSGKGDRCTIDEVKQRIVNYIESSTDYYSISVGSDSGVHGKYITYTTAIVIHRTVDASFANYINGTSTGGKGAIFFTQNVDIPIQINRPEKTGNKLKDKRASKDYAHQLFYTRMYKEAELSIALSNELKPIIVSHPNVRFKVDLDVGKNGKSEEVISTVVGMVSGYGYETQIKPSCFAANTVADRFC